MDKIFLVIGHTGDYDDYRTWTTKGFYDEKKAEEWRKKCNSEANRISSELRDLKWPEDTNPLNYWDKYNEICSSNEVDEDFCWGGDPVEYTVIEVEVE